MDLLEKEKEIETWKKRFERERALKKEAERLLEAKSLELYQAQQIIEAKLAQLEAFNRELDITNQKLTVAEEELRQSEEELRQNMEELDQLAIDLEEKVQERTRELEIQRTNILSSIRYAQRIQRAILPPISEIQESLPQTFIFYKPKDVVSGDFYWFARKGNKIVVAVVDCTGHGVPGAFMSMIGNDQLNEIVNLRGILEAHRILHYLDQGVKNRLHQEETDVNDGMEISLCVIDLETKKLDFAGAHNPLYYVQHGELHTVNGSKKPIGGVAYKFEVPYESHIIDITPPTMIYLLSDGFQDQSGINDKRFMRKRLRELLQDIHVLPVEEQWRCLLEKLDDWQQDKPQTDDILIMGIRVS